LVVIYRALRSFVQVLPDVEVNGGSWRARFTTAVLSAIGRLLIALYLGHSTICLDGMEAAGSLVALLIWHLLSCAILFYGAEFVRVTAPFMVFHQTEKHRGAGATRVVEGEANLRRRSFLWSLRGVRKRKRRATDEPAVYNQRPTANPA